MIFKKKEQTMSIKQFMNKGINTESVGDLKVIPLDQSKHKSIIQSMKKNKIKIASNLAVGGIIFATTGVIPFYNLSALASGMSSTPEAVMVANPIDVATTHVVDSIQAKIIHAFEPLLGLVSALSYPIAAVMISAGCLFIMIGNKDKGLGMIQMAGIGYILVQLSPLFMDLLVEISKMA